MKTFFLALFLFLIPAISHAQLVFPFSLKAEWDPNPIADGITHYIVTVNNNPPVTVLASSCSATVCSYPFTIPNSGPHTVTVVAANQWGSSVPASVTVTVTAPGKSNNIQIKRN